VADDSGAAKDLLADLGDARHGCVNADPGAEYKDDAHVTRVGERLGRTPPAATARACLHLTTKADTQADTELETSSKTSSPMEVGEVSCRYAHHEHERIAHTARLERQLPDPDLGDVSGQAPGQWC
jgi:hypothetical protein